MTPRWVDALGFTGAGGLTLWRYRFGVQEVLHGEVRDRGLGIGMEEEETEAL